MAKTEHRRSIAEGSDTLQGQGAPPSPTDREGFVERWSRLKAEQARTSPGEPAAASPAGPGSVTKDHEAELTDADMPPIESLGPDSDYSVFMGRRVSEELRRMALRKLFQLPQYRVRCTLNEYEGNFNDYLPLGNVVTHEMREMLLRQLRQTRAAGDEESNAAPAAGEEIAAANPVANAEEPDATAAPTHEGEVG